MIDRTRSQRGVTLIEMMVVVAVIGIVAATAAVGMGRARPRANLVGASVELRSLMTLARQRALMSGANVAVMIFPNYSSSTDSVGRVIVYQDTNFDLFKASASVHFGGYNPAVLAAGTGDEVIASFDLPRGVVFGPATGLGASATLPAPFATLPVNAECTFCDGSGTARRGAVVFNSRGRATFYKADGAALPVDGGSISLTATQLAGAAALVRMLSVSATTGSMQTVNQG